MNELERLLDETLADLPLSALSSEVQAEVERIMARDWPTSAYLDRMDHDRGRGG